MGRTLSDEEDQALEEALETLGVSSIQGLLEMAVNQTRLHIVHFMDPKLVKAGMPAPSGRLRDVFILIVNEFIKFSREAKSYPELPIAISKKRLSLAVSELIGQAPKTASQKVDQLVATGWLEARYGNILNPVATWYNAMINDMPHPGVMTDHLGGMVDK